MAKDKMKTTEGRRPSYHERRKRRQKIIFAVMAAVLSIGLLGSSVVWVLGNTAPARENGQPVSPGQSLADWQKQAAAHPNDAAIAAGLARAYDEAGKREQAVASYEKALRLDPQNGVLRTNLALNYFLLGQYDQAATQLQEEIRLHPDDTQAYYYYGQVLGYGKHDYQAAVRQLEKYVQLVKTGSQVDSARQMITQWQKLSTR
ncbi:tetratricopeptide repeat protein [Desulfotomaculum copahuensis]|uniref:Uncharacterized protein n=1 Tax=Desulfotomaculum copahuensis TaxID=1838280 RepID=A0A1B7LD48_9FIRM|nr:tetratricopeptide repeat protein [Desulfotomaculum copahuensis]OAT80843.1 hypothetical protein A6M21_12275 [Desulfotomaculum copahuensis]